MHAVEAQRRGGLHCHAGTVTALLWLVLAPCLTAAIEDRREAIAQESQLYRTQHFPDGRMPPKHDWRRQSPVQHVVGQSNEVPGGVGYGYFYNSSALLWTNSSIADYYVVAPSFAGGYVVSNLYLTATCRAQLGTESLVSYQSSQDAQFWIFDWAAYEANNYPWPVMIDLPTSNPQYLTMRPDEFAITRQMVHVRNGTYYLGFSKGLYNWQNQTLLFNFARGDWDYIYSYNYTTTNLTNNLPGGGAFNGSWGPIVETFGTFTNVNPVGYDLIRLFQDGKADPSWLMPSNSVVEVSTANWNLLTQAPNTGFSLSYGSNSQVGGPYNLGSLCVTATTNAASFSINSSSALISPYWITTPNSNRWDKTVVDLSPGNYTITFSPVSGFATPAPQVFTIATNSITTVQASYLQEPVLLSSTLSGQTLTCIWSAHSNSAYQPQFTTDLTQTNWNNWGSPVVATNGTVTTSYSTSANPQAFYRLMLSQ